MALGKAANDRRELQTALFKLGPQFVTGIQLILRASEPPTQQALRDIRVRSNASKRSRSGESSEASFTSELRTIREPPVKAPGASSEHTSSGSDGSDTGPCKICNQKASLRSSTFSTCPHRACNEVHLKQIENDWLDVIISNRVAQLADTASNAASDKSAAKAPAMEAGSYRDSTITGCVQQQPAPTSIATPPGLMSPRSTKSSVKDDLIPASMVIIPDTVPEPKLDGSPASSPNNAARAPSNASEVDWTNCQQPEGPPQ